MKNTNTSNRNAFTTTLFQAIKLGFDIDTDIEDIEELRKECLEFLNENSDKLPKIKDECEVTQTGHSQNVNYGDFTSTGDIIHFHEYYMKPRRKIYHSQFLYIDENTGQPYNMCLWCWSK